MGVLPFELSSSGTLFGVLAVAVLFALALFQIVVPATRPFLDEVCRGVERGRFWTRFLGLALLLAVPLGVLLGFVAKDRFLLDVLTWPGAETVWDPAVMLRMGLQLGACVLLMLVGGVLLTVPKGPG